MQPETREDSKRAGEGRVRRAGTPLPLSRLLAEGGVRGDSNTESAFKSSLPLR